MEKKIASFTLDLIKQAHSKVKTGADYPRYVYDLKQLGVKNYHFYTNDGSIIYYGDNSYFVKSDPIFENVSIPDESSITGFVKILKSHQKGETDFPRFLRDCQENGVLSWNSDLEAMKVTYYNKKNEDMYSEEIPEYKPE